MATSLIGRCQKWKMHQRWTGNNELGAIYISYRIKQRERVINNEIIYKCRH